MPKKSDIKLVGSVALGVMLAGFVMYQFRDVGIVAQSRYGYGA